MKLLPLPVYPRVYGGTYIDEERDGVGTGLSPRVRGNHVYTVVDIRKQGSIPACTGEPGRSKAKH